MKHLFSLLFCVGFIALSATAQNQQEVKKAKVVSDKSAIQSVTPAEAVGTQQDGKKVDTPKESVKAKPARPVIEMTDEYIDYQISEIQKVIDKNKGKADFNLSGYEKRIKYLELQRPIK